MVVWSGSDGGFSLFLSFRSFLSLTLILSLKLDVGFSFALNFFFVGIDAKFIVVAVGGDGFTMGLCRLL